MTDAEQRRAAKAFAAKWKDKGYEKGETQLFWFELMRTVCGIADPENYIIFEDQVELEHTSFIDARIPSVKVLIEQKGQHVNLDAKQKQSDGAMLTPMEQAQRYVLGLKLSEHPRFIVVCNFATFQIYDTETRQTEILHLADLPKEYTRLSFLVNSENVHLKREMELSIKAGEIVGVLYDEILKHYRDPKADSTLKSLNKLCVRLVFCLYAEDAGIFGRKNQFHDYLNPIAPRFLRQALIDLFKVLDTRPEERDPYLDSELAEFPYVNGGLFAEEDIEIPQLDETVKNLLLAKASDDFDWSEISPTIFGAVFESTLNPETRRSGGMHYTSIENIHKVIDPLFLDDLKSEFSEIKEQKQINVRNKRLQAFQEKIAGLKFLDPACGSGNFLTETYLSLRRLENEILKIFYGDQMVMDFGDVIKVSIGQFYGIEINDFAVTVAKTALWIAESQMMKATEDIVHMDLDFLPLKSYANIVEGNALRMDWNTLGDDASLRRKTGDDASLRHEHDAGSVVSYNYIIGNPPFVGARLMSKEQKEDLLSVFGEKWKNAGNLDYVACWYKKAADLIQGTNIHAALVSTNSISQGEQVAILWKPLIEADVYIDFAHRTFRWDSEASIKAHVHCVIIGFSAGQVGQVGRIFDENGIANQAKNISPYLIDAPNVFIESRNKPICDVPEIGIGNKPIDDGNYLFTEEEMLDFIEREPASKPFFKSWYGAEEFIKRKSRFCLWLGDCSPTELIKMPECLKRIENVRKFRLASKSEGTRKIAEKPTRFHVENMPTENYIVIPETSSEKRAYTPIGFLTPDVLCSNAVRLIPNATLYHFGILTSSVHMAWMRAVCGRLKSDYRYSKDIVYNNFPWPAGDDASLRRNNSGDDASLRHEHDAGSVVSQANHDAGSVVSRIEKTAQAILDARALYPDCSFADLYGDKMYLFPELCKAHQANDRAVMKAYGFAPSMTEAEIVAELMKRYQELTESVVM